MDETLSADLGAILGGPPAAPEPSDQDFAPNTGNRRADEALASIFYPQSRMERQQDMLSQAKDFTEKRGDASQYLRRIASRAGPFVSPAFNIASDKSLQEATDRFQKGEASQADILFIAEKQREQELAGQRGFGGKLVDATLGLAGIFGEGAGAGRLMGAGARVAGIAPRAATTTLGQIGQYAARNVPATLAMPSLYAHQAAQKNIAEGRDALDPTALPSALGLAYTQNLVLGKLSAIGSSVPGGLLARAGASGAGGALAMEGINVGAGMADEVLPQWLKTNTKYGTLGKMLGIGGQERDTGGALEDAAVSVLSFALFAGLHDKGPTPWHEGPMMGGSLDPNYKKPPVTGLEVRVPDNEIVPDPPLARRRQPVSAPQDLIDSFGLALGEMKKLGYTPEQANETVLAIKGRLLDHLADHPGKPVDLSIFRGLPEGAIRQFAEKMGLAASPRPMLPEAAKSDTASQGPPPPPRVDLSRFQRETPAKQMEGILHEVGLGESIDRSYTDNFGEGEVVFVDAAGGNKQVTLKYHPELNNVLVGFRDLKGTGELEKVPGAEAFSGSSTALFRTFKKVAGSLRDRGIGVTYKAHAEGEGKSRRDEAYSKILLDMGYKLEARKVEGNQIIASWRAPGPGEGDVASNEWAGYHGNIAPMRASELANLPRLPGAKPTPRENLLSRLRAKQGVTVPEGVQEPATMLGPRRTKVIDKSIKTNELLPSKLRKFETIPAGEHSTLFDPEKPLLARVDEALARPDVVASLARDYGPKAELMTRALAERVKGAILGQEKKRGQLSDSLRVAQAAMNAAGIKISHVTVRSHSDKAFAAMKEVMPELQQFGSAQEWISNIVASNRANKIADGTITADDVQGTPEDPDARRETLKASKRKLTEEETAAAEHEQAVQEFLKQARKEGRLNEYGDVVKAVQKSQSAGKGRILEKSVQTGRGEAEENPPAESGGVETGGAETVPVQFAGDSEQAVEGGVTERHTPTLAERRRARQRKGAINLPKKLTDVVEAAWDNWKKLGGQMFPKMVNISSKIADAAARLVSVHAFTDEATKYVMKTVFGPIPEAKRHAYMTAFHQLRLDYIGSKTTLIGPDSPIKTRADYTSIIQSKEFNDFLNRWKTVMVPMMEKHYRDSTGRNPTGTTQIPGYPINFKAVKAGDPVTPTAVFDGGKLGNNVVGSFPMGQKKGRLHNVKIGKLKFANQATGNADGYETGPEELVKWIIAEGSAKASKASLYRTVEELGFGMWDHPGKGRIKLPNGHETVEIRDSDPPKGTQANRPGQFRPAFYVSDAIASEFRDALQTDRPWAGIFGMSALNRASIASTVEASFHSANLLTQAMQPYVFRHTLKNIAKVIWNRGVTDAQMKQFVDLAELGATKERGFDTGLLLPKRFSAFDPTVWASRFLDVVDKVVRLSTDDAFGTLVRKGLVENTTTNRRDFLNQLGQYKRAAQAGIVTALRDSKLGPFAVAGTNYLVQGIRSLVSSPGIHAKTPLAAARLRAHKLAKLAAGMGAVALYNYLRWGRLDGDDSTPLGAAKLGEFDGRTWFIDIGKFTGATRGARATGLLATLEGQRKGSPPEMIANQAFHDVTHAVLHPAMGPGVNFAHTTITGTGGLGQQLAGRAVDGYPPVYENFKAAMKNANPSIAILIGADKVNRNEHVPFWSIHNPDEKDIEDVGLSRGMKLLDPYLRSRKTLSFEEQNALDLKRYHEEGGAKDETPKRRVYHPRRRR